MAEGQPMPALTTLQATPEYGCGGVNAPLSNLAAHALLGRGLQGISAAASTNKKSSSSGGGGVPLPCAFVPIPDVVAQVVASLEKGASSSGTSASGSNNQQGGGGGNGDVSSGGSIARPPTMGLSTQQPGAGAGSASQSSVLTSKGTSCFVSCYPSARGGATKDGKGFVPSDPSMTGGSMGAAGEQQEGCLLYTSDAADEEDSVDLGGRRIIKKKKRKENIQCKDEEIGGIVYTIICPDKTMRKRN
eukprot:TRINITY_DN6435_c0_g2_i1.p1 TRINITY_DN6435_c0_g2~~TRINITY_DN6435_c0_g2_i1.p1  ORF type:complete len:246 (+),score=41.52 TRINITY_DN6435_c0_g2_i1:344-1081(+)